MDIAVTENFLTEKQFDALRDVINAELFSWCFIPIKTLGPGCPSDLTDKGENPSTSPGQFVHMIYDDNVPLSQYYEPYFRPILEPLKCETLSRIKINLNHRLPEPFFSYFHIDPNPAIEESIMAQLTTAILYIDTNNGYSEFEDGTKVESVANRLVVFPANIMHRGVTQTDTQRRIVINFNYLMCQGNQ